MGNLFAKIKEKINLHIIRPVLESHLPVRSVAVGAAVGMFAGMTPTVGIQMWEVFMIWLIFKYIFRFRFDLVVGTALVWLSNPITLVPLYYGFLATGVGFFHLLGKEVVGMGYADFEKKLEAITENPALSSWGKALEGGQFLLVDLGYPMIIGSLFWATPLAILSYWATMKYLTLYRKKKAESLGISYIEWRERYERAS